VTNADGDEPRKRPLSSVCSGPGDSLLQTAVAVDVDERLSRNLAQD